jgi:hypothetical protein
MSANATPMFASGQKNGLRKAGARTLKTEVHAKNTKAQRVGWGSGAINCTQVGIPEQRDSSHCDQLPI